MASNLIESYLCNLELIVLPSDTKGIMLIDTDSERLYLLPLWFSVDLDGSKQLYLKCIYESCETPKLAAISEINFYRIKHYQGNKQMLVSLSVTPHRLSLRPISSSRCPSASIQPLLLPRWKYGQTEKYVEGDGGQGEEASGSVLWTL